ncbi:MAG: hypothetical protein AB1918_01280 [Pseudomonadota bacterium]
MKAKPGIDSHDEVVRRINLVLQGPVIDVLARLVPEVAALPRQDALELILDDVDLLYRCFIAFRANLALFRPLLVDARKRPVEDSETPLICGRSLDEIEAMVVRTAAKRHFRRRIDHVQRGLRNPDRPRRPAAKSGVFARLRALLTGQPTRRVRPKSQGDMLYDAVGPVLLHDWQLPLVPEYGQLPLGIVRRLGRNLLDYRVPEDVRRLKIDPDRPPPPTSVELMEYVGAGVFALPPITPPAASPKVAGARAGGFMAAAPELEAAAPATDRRAPVAALAMPDGKRLRPEAFAPVLLDPKVQAALPASPSLKPGGELALAGAAIATRLVDALDLDAAALAVLLVTAHARLGERHFITAFGDPGRPDYIDRLIARGRAAGIGPASTPAEVAAFVAGLFTTTK